jgi:hypothetical protein
MSLAGYGGCPTFAAWDQPSVRGLPGGYTRPLGGPVLGHLPRWLEPFQRATE